MGCSVLYIHFGSVAGICIAYFFLMFTAVELTWRQCMFCIERTRTWFYHWHMDGQTVVCVWVVQCSDVLWRLCHSFWRQWWYIYVFSCSLHVAPVAIQRVEAIYRSPFLNLCKLDLNVVEDSLVWGRTDLGYLPRDGRIGCGCWYNITIMLL